MIILLEWIKTYHRIVTKDGEAGSGERRNKLVSTFTCPPQTELRLISDYTQIILRKIFSSPFFLLNDDIFVCHNLLTFVHDSPL